MRRYRIFRRYYFWTGLLFIMVNGVFGQTTITYQLPTVDQQNFPMLDTANSNQLISIYYNAADIDYPIQPLLNGDLMRIEVFVPPGCAYVSITAQSNWWQAPGGVSSLKTLVGGFSYDPGSVYNDGGRPQGVVDDGQVYRSDLHIGAPTWSDALYGNASPNYPILTHPQKVYGFVHYPLGNTNNNGYFEFADLSIKMLVMDIPLYQNWRMAQGW